MINFEKSNNGISAINMSFLAGRNSQLGYTNGVTNLTSQMLLNGSKSYQKKHLNYKPLQMGGAINIGTSDNFTSINARCLDSNINEMIEMLFSMIFESNFNDIEKQKKIAKEINSNSMNDPYKILLDRLHLNCTDRKFLSLKLDPNFDDISIDEIKRFHHEKYIDPAISIISPDSNTVNLVNSLLAKYNVKTGNPKDKFIYSFDNNYDEFKWNISTNNRMLLAFVVDYSPIYDILTSVYRYKINKVVRMDKCMCARNRCILLPFGHEKRIFIVDIEFSKYENKDTIINDVMYILNNGYTKSEFEISKSQLMGDMLYNLCDPLKNVLMNSERIVLGHSEIKRFSKEIQECSFKDALEIQHRNYSCVIGVR